MFTNMETAVRRGQMRMLCAATLIFMVGGSSGITQSPNLLSQALDEWSADNKVALSPEVRNDLFIQAEKAIDELKEYYPEIPLTRLQQLVPKAATTFLDNTQAGKRSAGISNLLESLVSTKIVETGSGIGPFNPYPILIVEVQPKTPADFVITIDGTSYQAGFTTFRVTSGERSVQVTRMNRLPCLSKITVTQTGPNLISCVM